MTTREIPSWFSVSPTTGNGNQSVNVTAESNTDADARESELEISGSGVLKTLNVNQEGIQGIPMVMTFNLKSYLPLEGTGSGSNFRVMISARDITGTIKSKSLTYDSGTTTAVVKVDASDNIIIPNNSEVRFTITPCATVDGEDIQKITLKSNYPVTNWYIMPEAAANLFEKTSSTLTTTIFQYKGGSTSYFGALIFVADMQNPLNVVNIELV